MKKTHYIIKLAEHFETKYAGLFDDLAKFYKGYGEEEKRVVRYYDANQIADMLLARARMAFEEDGFSEGPASQNNKESRTKIREALSDLAPQKAGEVWRLFNDGWDNYIANEVPKLIKRHVSQKSREDREYEFSKKEEGRKEREKRYEQESVHKKERSEKEYEAASEEARKTWNSSARYDSEELDSKIDQLKSSPANKNKLLDELQDLKGRFSSRYNVQHNYAMDVSSFIRQYLQNRYGI